MKKTYIIICILLFGIIAYSYFFTPKETVKNPVSQKKEKPLLAYTFENLRKTTFFPSDVEIGPVVDGTGDSVSQMFYYQVPKYPGKDNELKTSGLMNIPKNPGTYPVIVMFRGFVPDNIYQPGVGTQHVAEVLAKHGYITLAPDFLGFGESASPSADGFEARFQTYTTALTLLSSLKNLNNGLDASYSGKIKADTAKIGIWGHSNGGHIALSVLAISGKDYPTVLWAPVSKSFPYSILNYTDEYDDQGKSLRKSLASFETGYDTDLFSPTGYYSWIKAPIQINQGENDQEVPVWWSDELADTLEKDKVDTQYLKYPQADHNMLPSGWNSAVLNCASFFDTKLKAD